MEVVHIFLEIIGAITVIAMTYLIIKDIKEKG